ncbi:M23 family metallopeptidase [Georgenia sp. SYP-B2076]|uniref:M23 family metallopeptidase n=1 Tax=Georgenia sp. SYP-B2076 TaxID=2495881 RepID=UPI000F8E4CD9|nr:M23 family metallopeptidase [Georgenia sp. SYP-B2076]
MVLAHASRLPLVAGLAALAAVSLGVLGTVTAPAGEPRAAPASASGVATAAPPAGAGDPAGRGGPAALLEGTGPPGGAPAPGDVEYAWPTGGPAEVVRAFDRPGQPWDAGHRGVDLALAVGAPVLAAADGVVAFAGPVVNRPVVSVQHVDGVRTTYEPVEPAVAAGQRVRAGDVLGHLVAGHCPAWKPACLHWGARTDRTTYLDPLALVGATAVVRLLPSAVGLPPAAAAARAQARGWAWR